MASQGLRSDAREERGVGRYDEDGSWWWDDGLRRWFRTADDVEHVEVDLEDYGGTSVLRRLATTLTGQYGTQLYRFVARRPGAQDPSADRVAVSGTFPASPLLVVQDDVHPRDAWSQEARDRLAELEHELTATGWRLQDRGPHWWSRTYVRPHLDADTPHDATPGSAAGSAAAGG